ncbi:TPA: TDP-N-acetylfucosamine:lipid II N-acetylfucosaminyltransferase [Vibrio parahaemolyticus]
MNDRKCCKNILHVGVADKFIPAFIEFNEQECRSEKLDHHYFFYHGCALEKVREIPGVRYTNKGILKHIWGYFRIIPSLAKADKIIMHGMFDLGLVVLMLVLPVDYQKVTWAIWGGDLYDLFKTDKSRFRKMCDWIKRLLIKRIGFVTTTIPGDYQLLKEHMKLKAKYVENIMYPSHFFREYVNDKKIDAVCDKKTVVQIGNSCDPRNNHIDAIERIPTTLTKPILLTLPMSYGNMDYRAHVFSYLEKKTKITFNILKQYLTFEEYNAYLSTVDVAIFNHDRQQAVGNIIALISLGKKVYIRSDVTTYTYLMKNNIIVFDAYDLSDVSVPLTELERNNNISNVRKLFNKECLKESWFNVYL